MHCKFLVFLVIVFLSFSFFSSACEFRLIERIGAHGKQNPDFIVFLNRLPTSLKELDSISTFKFEMKTFLFVRAFDLSDQSVNESYGL